MNTAAVAPTWHQALNRLPGLVNIGRFSLLLTLLTFHVFIQGMGGHAGGTKDGLLFFDDAEFYTWSVVYGVLIVTTLVYPQWQHQEATIPKASAVADITMIAVLMHLAGGINSGFGILILPFITASCLLSHGRSPLLYASYAALLAVFSSYWIGRSGLDGTNNARLWLNTVVLVGAGYLVAGLTAFIADYLVHSRAAYQQQMRLLNRFRGLTDLAFNHVQEAVVVLDERGRVCLLNQQARLFFPALQQDSATNLFENLQHYWRHHPQQIFEMDTQVQRQAVRVRAHPFSESDVSLLMLFIRPEQALAQEAMALKLTALGQLTANLAHEIRNPLSAIRQANGLLQEDEQEPLRRRLNSIIDGNVARIDKMLEDVSVLNKSDKVRRQSVELMMFWRLFRQEFTLTRPQARNSITLKVSDGKLLVWCDPLHLQQIMWNLFNNAWRHSQQDAQAIQVVFRVRSKAEVSIVVMDNGAGVAAEHQARLFEPFFTTESDGTGLGLYVARELAQANMGRLTYHAPVNGFELILPRILDE